jgi:hypothetical protein
VWARPGAFVGVGRWWRLPAQAGALIVWVLAVGASAMLGDVGPHDHFGAAAVTAWKLLAVGAVIGICWTGGRSVVAVQAMVVGWVAWSASEALLAAQPPDATPLASAAITVVFWLLPVVLLRPHRRELLRLHLHPSVILLPLALGAAVPLSVYAVHQGQGTTGPDFTGADMCALGVVLALQAVFASLRPRGTCGARKLGVATLPASIR